MSTYHDIPGCGDGANPVRPSTLLMRAIAHPPPPAVAPRAYAAARHFIRHVEAHLGGRAEAVSLALFTVRGLDRLLQLAGPEAVSCARDAVASKLGAIVHRPDFLADVGKGRYAIAMSGCEMAAAAMARRAVNELSAPVPFGKCSLYLGVAAVVCPMVPGTGDGRRHLDALLGTDGAGRAPKPPTRAVAECA